ncbi:hypothetical protein F5Y06DRAFT_79782 [Hypoxylon sp. FL0890]|nr:hypothetical protein F5Y06DRAFT_79782 [Hypoxylon sp. FL0890]
MGFSNTRNLKRIAVSLFAISSALSSFTYASSPSAPSESPSAETELICHTDNPAECYPKVFSATEEFQVVHDDQDLPPGLHVQLDVQTGQKQAKLYNPKEENPALEGLPVDRSVVVIDSEAPQDDKPRIPSGAPAYEPVGKVKAPQEKNEGFFQALETVKQHSNIDNNSAHIKELDKALEDLEDLSHGMYYGLQIAEDADALHALFCLLTKRDANEAEKRALTERADFLASSILASSIQNNKPALKALEGSWDAILEKKCAATPNTDNEARVLKSELYSKLEPTTGPGSAEEAAEAYFTRINLAVLDGLLKSDKIKEQFMAHDGMKNFLRILLRKEEVWDPRKAKVARIVSDTFLDEDGGARLGVWPTVSVTDASVCAKGGPDALEEGCWEYHLETISQDPKDSEWSRPLLDMLKQRRPEKPTHKKDEL